MSRSEEFAAGSSHDDVLPPAPGTAPVPEGHVRLYHQTRAGLAPAIAQEGLRADLGGKHGEPSGLWASPQPFYGNDSSGANIEFHVPVGDLTDSASDTRRVRSGEQSIQDWQEGRHSVLLNRNIRPEEFVGIHLPWHRHARYFQKEGMTDAVKAGEYDYMDDDDDYAPAIDYVKKHG